MVLVTHQQLIRYTSLCEEDCPHMAFPRKFLWKCTLTVALFFLFIFLLAFPVLAGVITFLVIYGGYYMYLFFRLLRTLNISRWKYAVFLAALAAVAYGLAQMIHAGVRLLIR